MARTIRIHPTAWNKHISMRFEVYYTDSLPAVESGDMSVAAVASGYPVYASDEWNSAHGIHRARIDYPKPRQGSQSWCAGKNNKSQWAGVDLVEPKLVTAVET